MNAAVIQVNNIICCKYAAKVLNKIMGIIEISGGKESFILIMMKMIMTIL